MTTELRVRARQSQQLYTQGLTSAWRAITQVHEPSLWLQRDPDVEEKMLRDADIAHAVGFRRTLIAGRQWEIVSKDPGDAKAELACDVATRMLDYLRDFSGGRFGLARAFFSGQRFARIHGQPMQLTIGDGRRRTWWVPVRIEDYDKRMYRRVPEMTGLGPKRGLKAHWERWDVPNAQWVPETGLDALLTVCHTYNDDQGTLGHGAALREALGWWWYAKAHVFQEALQAAERHGGGMLMAKVQGLKDASTSLPNTQQLQDWRDLLEDQRARHVLVFDAEDDVEVLSGGSEGWQFLQSLLEDLRRTIFTLVLGANLTTSADKGGSYALAEIQENSTEALIQYDREILGETITKDLLGAVWFKNHANLWELGIQAQKPKFVITQEKRQDPKERAEVASTLNQMGVNLSADDLYEQTGFRKPAADEDIIKGGSAQPASPFFPGAANFSALRGGAVQPPFLFAEWDEGKHPRDEDGPAVRMVLDPRYSGWPESTTTAT